MGILALRVQIVQECVEAKACWGGANGRQCGAHLHVLVLISLLPFFFRILWGTGPYVSVQAMSCYRYADGDAVLDNRNLLKLQQDEKATRDPITHLLALTAFLLLAFPFISYLSSPALGQRLLTSSRYHAATYSIPITVTPRSPLYNTYSITHT